MIRKSCIIYVLKIGFSLNKRNELMILASIGYISESIEKNKISIALTINICIRRNLYVNVSII